MTKLENLLNKMNKEQLEAIKTFGNVRVIAGAGSGKTSVLTGRIAYMVSEVGIPSENILAITFTNKAANEMKSRVMDLTENICNTHLSTYHSFCSFVLRKEGYGNTIIDTSERDSIIRKILKELSYDSKVKKYAEAISTYKNKFYYKKSEDIIYEIRETDVAQVFERYIEIQKKEEIFDFDDLIIQCYQLFLNEPKTLHKYQEKYQYLLVDEYQDSNELQFQLLKQLNSHNQLFVVGDPDQSIYSFRGADINLILELDEYFEDVKTIFLNKNYRSLSSIVSTSNKLISKNKDRLEKTCEPDRKNAGEVIIKNTFYSDDEETSYIVNKINELIEKEYEYKDIAILYRLHNSSRAIEQALVQNKIPYVIKSGIQFFDRKNVKDCIKILTVLYAPTVFSFHQFLQMVPKIGPTTIEKLDVIADSLSMTLEEFILSKNKLELLKTLSTNITNQLLKLATVLSSARMLNSRIDALEMILEFIEYRKNNDIDEENDYIGELEEYMDLFFSDTTKTSQDFLDEIVLTTTKEEDDDDNKVSLMTVHAAKGLEFPVVFGYKLQSGVFPPPFAEDLEEERRVAYVLFTRAKDILILTSINNPMPNANKWNYGRKTHGGGTPSIFFKDINETVTKNISSGNLSDEMLKKYKMPTQLNNTPKTHKLRLNDKVQHTVFGEGIVVKVTRDTVNIKFLDGSMKTISATHPTLQKI